MRNFVLCCLVLLSASMFADVDTNRSNGVNNGLGAGGTVYKTWGFMYRHHFLSSYEFHGPSDSKVSKNVWESGLGAGPGLEFFFNRYFSLHLELPWMTFVNIDSKGLAFLNSYPHIGGGLIYYF